MARLPQMPTPSDEFPIAFKTFAQTLLGTEDEVWIRLLNNVAGLEKLKFSEWCARLKSLKG